MNEHKIKHRIKKSKLLSPLLFLALAICFGLISVFALRANNQQMAELREAVYAADKDNGDVQTALRNLQAFVTSHMNTELSTGNGVYPPIQLKYTYERLVKAQGDSIAAANNKIYNDAQAYCESQNSSDFSGRNRVPCIEQYVQSHQSQSTQIQEDLYKFGFASPTWSPDLAGWSIVLTVVFGLLFVILFVTRRWLIRE